MILCGSENVYTIEVEKIINQFSNIKLSSVFGIEDDFLGHSVNAAIVVKNENIEIDIQKLKQFCSSRLASYKSSKKLLYSKKLPLTGSGKITKHKLINDVYITKFEEIENYQSNIEHFDYYFITNDNININSENVLYFKNCSNNDEISKLFQNYKIY